MEKIDINLETFMKLKAIKKSVIHIHKNHIYKRSPESQSIIETIDSFRTEPVFQHISTPEAYLYDKEKYFGYVMKYYKKLKQVNEAIKKGIIKDIETFALELLNIIEELNKLNLCYWDFHFWNVFSDKQGHPFILDIDDIDYFPSNEDLHNQKEYLTEFLLCIYLEKRQSVHRFAREEVIQKNFSSKTLNYIDSLGNLQYPSPDLPYCIIEELRDIEKRDMIKRKII